MKGQLQKIASSRTGGAKTDEALGKTGAGPEGLPHSIIVTAEGVEGETALATQIEADQAAALPRAEPDLLGDTATTDAPVSKEQAAKERSANRPPKKTTAKPDQIALFAGNLDVKHKSDGKIQKPAKPAALRKPQ